MEDATEKDLPAIPDEVLEAIAGGSMSEGERAWFLDWAADMKKKGRDLEYTAYVFDLMTTGAHRYDITTTEIRDLLEENWDSL